MEVSLRPIICFTGRRLAPIQRKFEPAIDNLNSGSNGDSWYFTHSSYVHIASIPPRGPSSENIYIPGGSMRGWIKNALTARAKRCSLDEDAHFADKGCRTPDRAPLATSSGIYILRSEPDFSWAKVEQPLALVRATPACPYATTGRLGPAFPYLLC